MATKKFAQMTTKKLNALLETANDEDKKEIEEVLAAREQAQLQTEAQVEEVSDEENPLTPEEEAAIKAAEENGGLNPMYNGSKSSQEKKKKMTDEERHLLAEELKANINHRCQAVPFNTVEWVDGYIAGVIEEKRTNKVLYAIKTDDGRRIVKVSDSNLIRIFDEVVEVKKSVRRKHKQNGAEVENVEWAAEDIVEEVNNVIHNVGKHVKFEKYRTTDEDGNENIEYTEGRIVAIVPDKRSHRLLYRISVPAPIEGNPYATKTMHKTITAELQIADEFDAEGEELNIKYRERRNAAITRSALTPQDRVVKCEEAVKKAEAKLRKASEDLEAKKQQFEKAKAEFNEWLESQKDETETEVETEAEVEAETEESLA